MAPDRVTRRPPRRSSKQTGGMLLPRTVHHLLCPFDVVRSVTLSSRCSSPQYRTPSPRWPTRRAEARPAARGDDALQRMIADRE